MTLYLLASVALVASSSTAAESTTTPLKVQTRIAQAHYFAALEELDRSCAVLAPDVRAERARLLDELRAYAERADFGRNELFPGAQVPHFVDGRGRRCAVANLMHASGEDEFVASVAEHANFAWVCELSGDPTFESWLARSGLTLAEAARIQCPPVTGHGSYDGGPGDCGEMPTPHGHPSGGSYTGPGDTVGGGAGPATGGRGAAGGTGSSPTSGGGGRTGPASSGNPGGSTGGPGPSMRPTTVGLTTTDDDGWWLWWEYNKSEFLRPNRLNFDSMPVTGDDPAAQLRRVADRMRADLLPIVEAGLTSPDAEIRAAATIASGRVARATSVEKLLPLLHDSNMNVRENTILALGSTGSARAASVLLALARTGSIDEHVDERVTRTARPLAIVALGLMRAQGMEPAIDLEIARLVRERSGSDREAIAIAGMLYQTLVPCEALEKASLEIALDDHESPSVRCRATEALRSGKDTTTLARLQDLLHGARLDLRRSAALALGGFHDDLALPGLETAFETEAEGLTKGFILTSIGRRGGDDARKFLEKQLEHGESGMRRWAALGLGLWARKTGDGLAAVAIRAARDREKNHDVLGAYLIALGLARDEASRPLFEAAVANTGDPRERAYAATALALVGGESSRTMLRARLPLEKQGLARIGIAQSLAYFGNGEDAPLLVTLFDDLHDPSLQAQVSSAMAVSGTPEALLALAAYARDGGGPSVRRAAIIEGLGMLLGQTTPMRLLDVARGANYTVFNEWVQEMFQTTI